MACPYFYPAQPSAVNSGAETAMLPLGDRWTGICRADPESPAPARETAQRPFCNLGYARLECGCFPEGEGPDAVRFTVRAAEPGILRLYYVLERDHNPFAHGPLEYSRAGGVAANFPADSTLARQAQAYAESYLRRKAEAARA
jgi:hypothetical protein